MLLFVCFLLLVVVVVVVVVVFWWGGGVTRHAGACMVLVYVRRSNGERGRQGETERDRHKR